MGLRPQRQYRSRDAGAGRRTRRLYGFAALTLLFAAFVAAGCACGDDDGGKTPTAGPAGSGTAAASPAALKAVNVLPDLSSLDFTRQPPEALPSGGANVDAAFAFYARAQPAMQARVEVHVFGDEKQALSDYGTQSQGWKTPPPGLFPVDLKNVDATPLTGPTEAKAYRSTQADQGGNLIWTDVYRVGKVVVIAHVLGRNETDATPVRQAIATQVQNKAK